ncbi:hypothetical protein K469DRAFT_230726 [Zopfia rhizophila CBS 207.26]|uniref:Uncharacterized protein n=1 Tax=Zopfia rhizophila CBS 207.26 TaxID=1314779 RepID=A0A6A6DXI4_9PEZI|nr:hypothetical protein K469DRAFT_230726 [Zopfia rhizophila CBS 207.26]
MCRRWWHRSKSHPAVCGEARCIGRAKFTTLTLHHLNSSAIMSWFSWSPKPDASKQRKNLLSAIKKVLVEESYALPRAPDRVIEILSDSEHVVGDHWLALHWPGIKQNMPSHHEVLENISAVCPIGNINQTSSVDGYLLVEFKSPQIAQEHVGRIVSLREHQLCFEYTTQATVFITNTVFGHTTEKIVRQMHYSDIVRDKFLTFGIWRQRNGGSIVVIKFSEPPGACYIHLRVERSTIKFRPVSMKQLCELCDMCHRSSDCNELVMERSLPAQLDPWLATVKEAKELDRLVRGGNISDEIIARVEALVLPSSPDPPVQPLCAVSEALTSG